MPEAPSVVTVNWVGDMATVTVHGGLDPDTASQVRERIGGVAASRPTLLVLDLTGVAERYGAECLALVAVTQHLLPQGAALDVRSDSPAVRQILALADRTIAQESAGGEKPKAV